MHTPRLFILRRGALAGALAQRSNVRGARTARPLSDLAAAPAAGAAGTCRLLGLPITAAQLHIEDRDQVARPAAAAPAALPPPLLLRLLRRQRRRV